MTNLQSNFNVWIASLVAFALRTRLRTERISKFQFIDKTIAHTFEVVSICLYILVYV